MAFALPPRVLVIGLGRSGLAAARLAARGGAEVWVTDVRPEDALREAITALPPGARLLAGGHPPEALDGVGLVVASPGVPADSPILVLARERGIALLTELEFAWMHRPDAPLVAVTGSNGKSTVTSLVAAMLSDGVVAARAGGNLGPAASDLVLEGGWSSWVLEVSSFQAELLTAMRPTVGVFLNLSPDHLERHPTLAAYLEAKQRLFAFQEAGDAAVLNLDDPAAREVPTAAEQLGFSLQGPASAWLDGGTLRVAGEPLCAAAEVALSGRHNIANALAAALAAHRLGVPHPSMAGTLASFSGLPHRHRTVADVGGVRWVDDSKATNVGATLAGLAGYPDRSVHLILGGLGKGQDFAALAEEVARAAVRVYLIGTDGPRIGEALAGLVAAQPCGTLDAAVASAARAARSGEVVLLAPACASFDQFSGYAQRGERFAELVAEEVSRCR